MKCAPIFASVALSLGSSGCASIGAQKAYWNRDPEWPVYVMGGAVADVAAVVVSVSSKNSKNGLGFLLIFDLPFSLGADILLLPLCIYQQIERTTWKEDEFIARLEDPDEDERQAAAKALGVLEGTTGASIDALERALVDVHPRVRREALASLASLETKSARTAPAVVARLDDAEAFVRSQAARTLARIGADPGLTIPALIRSVEDPNLRVRCEAIEALGQVGRDDPTVFQVLQRARDREPGLVQEAAEAALKQCSPRP